MSKQDVIDYVMETPHNTNRAVLEGLVDQRLKRVKFKQIGIKMIHQLPTISKTNPQSTLLFPPLLKM